MRNIKLTIQYDGTAYNGWQRQATGRGYSVQQAIESNLARICGTKITLHGAGRTDSGVHALAQTANFACPDGIPTANIARVMNHTLPADIRIRAAEEMPPDFHARFSAKGKRYRYLLATDKPNAFNYRWYLPIDKLPDVEAMETAATLLLGEHDFRHFTLTKASVRSYVRDVRDVRIFVPSSKELPCALGQPLAIEAVASGFLYKMMRLVVSRLLAVGQGLQPPGSMQDYLLGRPPRLLPPAPARGLMLMQVYYD